MYESRGHLRLKDQPVQRPRGESARLGWGIEKFIQARMWEAGKGLQGWMRLAWKGLEARPKLRFRFKGSEAQEGRPSQIGVWKGHSEVPFGGEAGRGESRGR